jgi:RanBP1 domain
MAVTPDMKLSPNVGSDRSWVWNVAADVSEGEPEAQTLAIRFANPESERSAIISPEVEANRCRCQSLQGSIHQGTAGEREALQLLRNTIAEDDARNPILIMAS